MPDDFLDEIAKLTGRPFKTIAPTTNTRADALKRAADKLGVDAADLGSIISFETGGTLDPHKVGGEGNKYKGLIQFGPAEQKKYYNPKDTFETQVENGVVRYFQDRFKQAGKDTRGATLEDLYTTVIAGNPKANRNAKDSFGTSARSGTQRILKEHRPKVLKDIFGGALPTAQTDDLLDEVAKLTGRPFGKRTEPTNPVNTIPQSSKVLPTPVPETQTTLTSQMASLMDPASTRIGVLLTPGETPPVDLNPSKFRVFDTKNGAMVVNLAQAKKFKLRNPADIQGYLDTNPNAIAQFTGKVENHDDTSTGTAVVTYDKDGNELHASKVSGTKAAIAQGRLDKQNFKDGVTQKVVPAQKVVEDRALQLQREAIQKNALPGEQPYQTVLRMKGGTEQIQKDAWLAKNPAYAKFATTQKLDPFADTTLKAYNDQRKAVNAQRTAKVQSRVKQMESGVGGQYEFQKTGKLVLPATMGRQGDITLTYSPDESLEKNGEYRVNDAEGNSYIFNPKAGKLVDEADETIISKIKLPLPEKGTQTTAITKRNWAETIADSVAQYADIPREDVADFFAQYGFEDFKTKEQFTPDRYFRRPFVNPMTGVSDEAKTEDFNLTQRDINRMLAFSKDRADTKAVYEKAKKEAASAGDDEYVAEIKGRKVAGWMPPSSADEELEIYNQKKKEFNTYFDMPDPEGTSRDANAVNELTQNALNELRQKYGSFKAIDEEKRRIAALPISERVVEAGRSLVAVIPKAIGAILKTAGALDYGVGQANKLVGLPSQDKIQDTLFFKMGVEWDWIGDIGKNEVAHTAWESKVADTIGQVAIAAGSAWATGGMTLPATIGLTMGFGSAVDESAKEGNTPGQQFARGVIGAAAAMPDILIMKGMFRSLTGPARVGLVTKIGQSLFTRLAPTLGKAEASLAAKGAMQAFIARSKQLGQKILFPEAEMVKALTAGGAATTLTKNTLLEAGQEWQENDINLIGKKFISNPEITWGDIAKISDEDVESIKYGAVGGLFGGGIEVASHPDSFKTFKEKRAAFTALNESLADSALVKKKGKFTLDGQTFEMTAEVQNAVTRYESTQRAIDGLGKDLVKELALAKKAKTFGERKAALQKVKAIRTSLDETIAYRDDYASEIIELAGAGNALENVVKASILVAQGGQSAELKTKTTEEVKAKPQAEAKKVEPKPTPKAVEPQVETKPSKYRERISELAKELNLKKGVEQPDVEAAPSAPSDVSTTKVVDADVAVQASRSASLRRLKKIADFTTDEGKFANYDIDKDHRGRADMFVVLKDPNGYIVRNAFVPDAMQRSGLATELYQAMNTESLKKTGKPLRSTQPRTLVTGEVVHELTPDSIALWDSFVKKGVAEKLGDKDYRFLPTATKAKTPKAPVPTAPKQEGVKEPSVSGLNALHQQYLDSLGKSVSESTAKNAPKAEIDQKAFRDAYDKASPEVRQAYDVASFAKNPYGHIVPGGSVIKSKGKDWMVVSTPDSNGFNAIPLDSKVAQRLLPMIESGASQAELLKAANGEIEPQQKYFRRDKIDLVKKVERVKRKAPTTVESRREAGSPEVSTTRSEGAKPVAEKPSLTLIKSLRDLGYSLPMQKTLSEVEKKDIVDNKIKKKDYVKGNVTEKPDVADTPSNQPADVQVAESKPERKQTIAERRKANRPMLKGDKQTALQYVREKLNRPWADVKDIAWDEPTTPLDNDNQIIADLQRVFGIKPKEAKHIIDQAREMPEGKEFEPDEYMQEDLSDAYKSLRQKQLDEVQGGLFKETPVIASKVVEKLDDYGEKIGGAKKDLATRLSNITSDDIKSQPLSKSFPEPDYAELAKAGTITAEGAKFLKYTYDAIPPKPRKSWKLDSWVKMVERGVDLFRQIVTEDGTKNTNFTDSILEKSKTLLGRDYNDYSKTMDAIGFPESNINLGKYRIRQFAGRKGYSVVNGSLITGDFATFEEAAEALKKQLGQSKSVAVKLNVYQDRQTKKFFIGKKGARGVVHLVDDLASAKEAFEFIESHRAEIEGMWNALKINPEERNSTNRTRVGNDWRKGENITPERFAKQFGFRGIEFGNWVNNAERQKSVNDAYDALMDMAGALGISPEAISLNGELGLAFGSRGSGKASAHYEPSRIVINLTKTKGKGSLGHEWWHALDNYFSRMRGYKGDFVTDNPRQFTVKSGGSYGMDESVRKEMLDAFKGVIDAINASKLPARSGSLDATRQKPYWSTPIEMTARSFENYLITKLAETGGRNDYLANFKDTAQWITDSKLQLNNYPYPLIDEAAGINEAYQQFFDTVEEAVDADTGNVILRSVPDTNKLNDIIDDRGNIDYGRAKDVAGRILSGKQEIRRLSPEGERGRIAGGRGNGETSVDVGADERAVQKASPATGSRVESDADTRLDTVEAEVRRQMDAVKEVRNDKGQLLAPNGKVSNLNEYQWKSVRTKNFIEFFGDWINDPENASKVVDENGEPLVMAHGTSSPNDFDVFRRAPNDIGIHIGTKGQANDRIDYVSRHAEQPKHQRVLPVFVRIENPLRMEDAGWWDWNNVPHALEQTGKFDADEIKHLEQFENLGLDIVDEYNQENDIDRESENYEAEESYEYQQLQEAFAAEVRDLLAEHGYDGIVYRNTGESGGASEFQKTQDAAMDALIASQKKRGKPTNSFDKEDHQTPEYKAYNAASKATTEYRENNAEDSYIALDPTQIKSSISNNGNYDAGEGSILKKTRTTDAMDELETLKQARDFAQIVPKVESSVEDGNVVYLKTSEASEVMRTLISVVEGTARDKQPLLQGLFLTPNRLTDIKDALSALIDESDIDTKPLKSLLSNIEKAETKNGAIKLKVFDEALPHEEAHESSWLGSKGKPYVKRYANADKITSYEPFKRFKQELELRMGMKVNDGVALEEALAYLGTGDLLGVNIDEATEILALLVEGYAEANGVESLQNFKPGTQLYEAIEKRTESQSSKGSDGTRSNVSEGRQTGRETATAEDQGDVGTEAGFDKASGRDGVTPGKSGLPFDPVEAEKARKLGQKVAAFSRIIGHEYYYDPQNREATDTKAAQLVGKMGVSTAIDQALNGKPSAEGMRVVYWELERLAAQVDAHLLAGRTAEAASVATRAAELAAAIVQRQVAAGQEVEIGKTLATLSPESALIVASRMVRYATKDGKLSTKQSEATVKLANELRKEKAKLAEARLEIAKQRAKIRRLENDRPARKRVTSQDKLLKDYKSREGAILAKLREAFPNSPMFNGSVLRMVAWRFAKPAKRPQIAKDAPGIFWHGSDNADLRGGTTGLHIGTYKAAQEALEARIGVPADGEWDGTTAYGDTLLMGKRRLLELQKQGIYKRSGYNVYAPDEDYYPRDQKKRATYSDGTEVPLDAYPIIEPVRIIGSMTNSRYSPRGDWQANGLMKRALRKGNARNGFYYTNESEDAGSISAVVPNDSHIERLYKDVGLPVTDPRSQEILRSVPDNGVRDALVEYAIGQILQNRTYEAVIGELQDISGLTTEQVKGIHASAVEVLRPARTTADTAQAAIRKIRQEHYKQAKAIDQNIDKKIDPAFKKKWNQNVRELGPIAQEAMKQFPDDTDLVMAVERLTGKSPKNINDVVKDLMGGGRSVPDATQLARKANSLVKAIKEQRAADKAKAEGKLQEALLSEREARIAAQKKAGELRKFLANLAADPNVIKRFNNDFRAKVVLNWGTQIFNGVQAMTIATPAEFALDVLEAGLRTVGVNVGDNVDMSPSLLAPWYVFATDRQMAEDALSHFPEAFYQLHAGLMGDIEIDPRKLAEEKTGLTKYAHKYFDANERLNEFLAKITGAKLQEMHFRNAQILTIFDGVIRSKTKGQESLKSALEHGTFTKYITEKEAQYAVDRALRVTMASQIDDPIGKQLKQAYDWLDNYVPVILNPVTFARFTYTASKVTVINPIMFGAMDSAKLGGQGYNNRSIAKGVLAWSGIAMAYGLQSLLGGDDDKWYTLYIFGKDKAPLDIRRFYPVSAYFYMAHLIRNFKDGRPLPSKSDLLAGFASLELDYFQYGAPMQALSTAGELWGGTKDWGDLGSDTAAVAASWFAGSTRFFKPMKDVLAQAWDKEAAMREYDESTADKVMKELGKSLPVNALYGENFNVPIKKDMKGNDVITPFPLARMIGVNIVHPSLLSKEDSVATEWANRLFPYTGSSSRMTLEERKAYNARKAIRNAVRSGQDVDIEGVLRNMNAKLSDKSLSRLKAELKHSELGAKIKFDFGDNKKDIEALKRVWRHATPSEKDEINSILRDKYKKKSISRDTLDMFDVNK